MKLAVVLLVLAFALNQTKRPSATSRGSTSNCPLDSTGIPVALSVEPTRVRPVDATNQSNMLVGSTYLPSVVTSNVQCKLLVFQNPKTSDLAANNLRLCEFCVRRASDARS